MRLDNLAELAHTFDMKELLRSTDITVIAFAQALLRGEDIAAFEMDVNMSVLEGGIGIFPRRLMVHPDAYDAAARVLLDNDIPLGL
jgi:hypothetical protein